MKPIEIHASGETILSDDVTPVHLFRIIKDKYPYSVLLESNDYHGKKDATSIIAFNAIVTFIAEKNKVQILGEEFDETFEINHPSECKQLLKDFISSINVKRDNAVSDAAIGCIGHTTYDAVQIFEDITLKDKSANSLSLPYFRYSFYEYQIIINHFNNTMMLVHNKHQYSSGSLETLRKILKFPKPASQKFTAIEPEIDLLSDGTFKDIILQCKSHISRGDVFQIVPSRRFARKFAGDDFELYRMLRSVNPSPYLFYLDCGDYRLFGSSPEAQLLIQNGEAEISPIAGTYKRTGDSKIDTELAEKLLKDEKENAEHVMLVDLARNDLNRHCTDVTVKTYREVQFYSHVIHLVSRVTGQLHSNVHTIDVFGDTFPAGTLTGAPKYKAMQLIDTFEPISRGMYGGAVGMFGCDGSCVHAIFIRSFVSQHGTIYYQAGCGVVSDSSIDSEMLEVHNKLGALKSAINKCSEDIL